MNKFLENTASILPASTSLESKQTRHYYFAVKKARYKNNNQNKNWRVHSSSCRDGKNVFSWPIWLCYALNLYSIGNETAIRTPHWFPLRLFCLHGKLYSNFHFSFYFLWTRTLRRRNHSSHKKRNYSSMKGIHCRMQSVKVAIKKIPLSNRNQT